MRIKNKNKIQTYEFPYLLAKEEVRKRDNYTCQNKECNKKSNLTVHHIVPKRQSKQMVFDEDNMITLCRKCHDKVEDGELKIKKIKGVHYACQ